MTNLMNNHTYLDGLIILGYLELNLGVDKLELFEEKFNYYYNIRINMPGKMDFISFLSITENAYASALSDKDVDLESKLKEEFSEKVKLNQFILKEIVKDNMKNRIIMSTMN